MSPKWGTLVALGWRDIGGIGLEGTLVSQRWGHWCHWVGSDIGDIGLEGTLVSPMLGTLVSLGWK